MKIAGQTGHNQDAKSVVFCFQQFRLHPAEIYFSGTWDKTETDTVPPVFHSGTASCDRKRSYYSTYGLFHRLRRIRQGYMCGTVGQEGLNLLNRTIKCPTKLSHFGDERDTWDGRLECKLQPVVTSKREQAKACTLNFFWDMGQNSDCRRGPALEFLRLHRSRRPILKLDTLDVP